MTLVFWDDTSATRAIVEFAESAAVSSSRPRYAITRPPAARRP
jgi:hypothetical protein